MSTSGASTEGDQPTGQQPAGKTFTQDEVNSIVAAERRRIEEEKVNPLQQQVDSFNAEKAQFEQKVDGLSKEVTTARGESTRYKVALDMGLPATVADRLRGDDEAALRADAETLKGFMAPAGGSETPAPDLGGGAKPDATAETDQPSMNDLIRAAAGKGEVQEA